MRLSPEQIQAIRSSFINVFCKGEVILFGSRVDDNKKGGDIDLYVSASEPINDLFKLKLKFLVDLKSKIGEQKIDLVLEPFASNELKQEVQRTGIKICQI
ncbi:hypothetical protein THMIRHAM_05290 [Thiomicrorhabdus immobilis]|uniref:Polymerase beta nucleotidyltransferase domain-containing protein n=1 Tax=Thiomicrorhabdus immobilis TaxID=2791037 RepID=A0ABN6CVY6_9GAMM|nr:nucleotidyltransferase domain-containing protein [Thiomicrorhabdus immobilis]BCN92744.1 hypothetical protein THMIRHAM_05290 [Thiomicrorhabdus immobilis]